MANDVETGVAEPNEAVDASTQASDGAFSIRDAARGAPHGRIDRFMVLGRLGEGGMGTVFLGQDLQLDRKVAIKLLHGGASQVSHARLVREAQAMAKLSHPNVVAVYDVGRHNGQVWIAMEYVPGETLGAWVRAKERGQREILANWIAAGHGLAAIHAAGLIHRDIKPSNIMIGRHGAVYMVDWGLARPYLDPSASTSALREALTAASEPDWLRDMAPLGGGTPAFIAPEQARDEPPTPASDIFALGAVLYFILTGQGPFHDDSPERALERARACDYPLPSQLRSDISPALEAIVLRAMSADPRRRHADAEELGAALTRYLRDGGWDFTELTVPAGTYVLRQGEAADAAYIIVDGRCEVSREENGQTRVLRIMEAGEVFGETAILAGSPRTASVKALSDLTLYAIRGEVFTREVGNWNPLVAQFVKTLALRAGEEG
ncbi:MAG: protein kinase [Myxococcales bacterium]|nr:protein kinase [Myxococcales bacterium]